MNPITAGSDSRRSPRGARPCRDRSIPSACWSPNWSRVPSPMCPGRYARTGISRASAPSARGCDPGADAVRPSQLLRDAEIEAAARSELRRKHADAGAVADLVDGVEQIDDVESQGGRLGGRYPIEVVRRAEIALGVGRHGAAVRNAIGAIGAQAAAIDRIDRELGAIPQIRSADRRAEQLGV